MPRQVEVSTGEWEQAGCGEATLLAEDSGRGSDEWDIDAGVLPAATFEGNAVLLVAADAEVRGSGTEGRAAVERERASFALVSEEVGAMTADLELVLRDGRRLRIGRGVEEESLRAVLAALEPTSPRYRT